MPTLTMTPGSTATFTITVQTASGTLVTTASINGVFRRPNETVVASNLVFANAGEGKYTVQLEAAWTTHNNQPHPGRYLLDVTVTNAGSATTERFTLLVAF